MDGVSVIVCCYNSLARIEKTLRHLSLQKTEGVAWEVIIVDNGSTDDTKNFILSISTSLFPSGRLRIVDQPIKGLSSARAKGVESASYDSVIFCDDDNWLSSDYVYQVHRIFNSDKNIGAIGGKGIPATDVKLPDWFDKFGHLFATGPQGSQSGEVVSPTGSLYGAGLAIRKDIFDQFKKRGYSPFLTDRTGAKLTSGGDTELCYIIRLMGFKLWYSDTLTFQHFLPAGRLTEDYLKRLFRSMNESYMLLITYRYALMGVPIGRATWLKDFMYQLLFYTKGVASHLIQRNERSRLEADASRFKLSAMLAQAGSYRSRIFAMNKLATGSREI